MTFWKHKGAQIEFFQTFFFVYHAHDTKSVLWYKKIWVSERCPSEGISTSFLISTLSNIDPDIGDDEMNNIRLEIFLWTAVVRERVRYIRKNC